MHTRDVTKAIRVAAARAAASKYVSILLQSAPGGAQGGRGPALLLGMASSTFHETAKTMLLIVFCSSR